MEFQFTSPLWRYQGDNPWYVLPMKKAVRLGEGLEVGEPVGVEIGLIDID